MVLKLHTRGRGLAVIAIASALFLSACGGGDSTEEPAATDSGSIRTEASAAAVASGDPVRIALSTEIASLDPHERDVAAVRQVSFNNVFESLFRWTTGSRSEIEPLLAESAQQTSDTVLQVTLREGVQFHNGEPFNAEAAAFSIMRILDPSIESEIAGTLETVVEARAIDEMTLEIETNGPDPILQNRLTRIMMVPKGYVEDDPTALRDAPIGTGPYQFVERTTDGVELEVFPDYWGQAPSVQTIEFVTRLDPAARVAALEAGEVQIIADLPPEAADRVPNVLEIPSLEVLTLRLNGDGGLTEDIRVREAIGLAIDKDGIRESFFGDRAVTANGQIVPPGVAGFNDELDPYSYDPDAAAELVTESGVGDQPLRFMFPEGRFPKINEISEAITAQLEAVGFTVELNVLDYQRWLDEILNSGPESTELSLSATGSDALHDASQPFNLWVPEEGLAQVFPDAFQPEAEDLYQQALTELDSDVRADLLAQVSALIYESDYHVPIAIYNLIWGTTDGIAWDLTEDDQIRLSTLTAN